MAESGFSVGTATGGGTFRMENLSGTLSPVGVTAWGGAGTVTRVGPTMAAALPVGIYGGTFNAGTVFVSNTGTVVGTVAVSNTGTVVGTVATSNAGTVAMLQAGSVQVTAGTMTGTVAISTIAAGTVVATAAGTQLVSGTVNTGNTGTVVGTVSVAGTVPVATTNTGTVTVAGTVPTTLQNVGTIGGTVSVAGTVPVSGDFSLTPSGTQLVAGTVSIDGGVTVGTVHVSSGTLDALGGTVAVNVVAGAAGGVSHIDDAAFTAGTDDVVPAAAMFDDTTPDSVDEGDAGVLRMSGNRNLYTTIRDAAGNERGVNVTAGNALVVDNSAVTQPISGTVGVSSGTVATSNAGTVAMVQAGSVQVTAGTFVGTVATSNAGTIATIQAGTIAVSTIAAGTVVATAAGTQTVAGTVNTGNAGTIATIQAGTVAISTIAAGTVAATQAVGAGKTLTWGTINLTSGSVSLVNPGSGTTAYIVGITLTAGTAGIIQFLQGVGAAALSGPIHLDQYGGFVAQGRPSSPVLKGAAGSQIYLQITSGIGTAGGFYSYFTEA